MPYPNEHAARLENPDQFDRFRRDNDAFGDGIDAIYGIKDGKSTLQAIRFDSSKFSSAEAREWLDDHDHGDASFEAAVSKKRSTFRVRVPFSKIDDELRVVYGWAYVCEIDGRPVVDHSGDVIPWQEIEKCAHRFNVESRVGGVMHKMRGGDVVANLVFSPDVQEALGIDIKKVGWFIGYKVNDDDAWAKVKDGTYTGFSIAGSGLRRAMSDAEAAELGV